MKKLLLLTMVLLLGIAGAALAAEALTDAQLADVSGTDLKSGSWVTENNLNLNDDSQKDIQAVSNANAVDSAIAAQFNLDNVTMGGSPISNTVSNTNIADLKNYRPADALDLKLDVTKTKSEVESEDNSTTANRNFLGIFGAGSGSTDKSSENESCTETINLTVSARKSQAQKNTLNLNATSQQNIQAVSNLNAVASAAAVQTNIVSNMGVSGTITNSNSATVMNGF